MKIIANKLQGRLQKSWADYWLALHVQAATRARESLYDDQPVQARDWAAAARRYWQDYLRAAA